MSTVRVIRVLGSFSIGGAERRTLDLLPRLVAAGIEPHFVLLSGHPGVLAPRAEALGARIHLMRLDIRFPIRFIRLLRQLRPRAVHSDVATFSGALLLLAAICRVPVRIAHFRSDGDDHGDNWRRRLQRSAGRRLIDHYATRIVGVSPSALTHGYLPTWPSDPRCLVLPNGLDTDALLHESTFDLRAETGASKDEILLLHVGRASPEKRRWLIPPIVAALREHGIASRAVLIGPRGRVDDQRVFEAARARGVEDRVHLLGARDDIGSLLRQADVVLLPSSREGLPGAVLEGIAVGTPVVASDLPGVRFIAAQMPGVTTINPHADANAWAAAVRTALNRTELDQTDSAGGAPARDTTAALSAFQGSVFSIEVAATSHLALYAGTAPDPRPVGAPR